MSNVKNKKMINQIALKSLKARKKRNLIAILAIALTSVLFTALFTIGGSLIEKNQESTMRQVGGSAHAGYKYLTKSECVIGPTLLNKSFLILALHFCIPELIFLISS